MQKFIVLFLLGTVSGLVLGYAVGHLSGLEQREAEWEERIIRCANEIGAAGRFAEFEIQQENGKLRRISCGDMSISYL
jgi:hypothetical protein